MPRIAKRLSVFMGVATVLFLVSATPRTGWAQSLAVTYFDATNDKNEVRFVDASDINLCAEIYVFDATETMVDCCACGLTPQHSIEALDDPKNSETNQLPGIANLLWKPFGGAGFAPLVGLVDVISAPFSGQPAGVPHAANGCPDAGGAQFGSSTPLFATAPILDLWIEHNDLKEPILSAPGVNPTRPPTGSGVVTGSTEVNFRYVPLQHDNSFCTATGTPAACCTGVGTGTCGEQASLEDQCNFIQGEGTGRGICQCPVGD